MGRYIGPVEKLERREGVPLDLKGERHLLRKTSLERRGPVPPGQHGARRRRGMSVYGTQLREAQKLKIAYGVREKQMRRLVGRARRHHESTAGEALIELLERRLDNVVFRLGLASTRRQARQFISHGHVQVDEQRLDIASAQIEDGQKVRIAPAHRSPRWRRSGRRRSVGCQPGSRSTRRLWRGGCCAGRNGTRSRCRSPSSW